MVPVNMRSKFLCLNLFFFKLPYILQKLPSHEELILTKKMIKIIFYQLQESPNTPYSCNEDPTLLSVYVEKFNFKLVYDTYFGGVVSIKLHQFLSINGMSNRYFFVNIERFISNMKIKNVLT